MKKLMMTILIVLFLSVTAYAAEDFTGAGWSEYIDSGSVTFAPSGTTLTINASDGNSPSAYGSYYKNFGVSLGGTVTLNVNNMNGDGQVGIRKYVARNFSNNRIMIDVYLNSWDGRNTLRYRIRERSDDRSIDKQLAIGYFGENNGHSWSTGETLTLGFWYKNSVAYFYCSKFPGQLSQVYLPQIASTEESSLMVYGLTENQSSLSATASDLNIYSDLSQLASITGVPFINPVPIQADLSFTVPSMSFESSDIWTKFKFAGELNGKLMFELESYGVNE